MIQQRSVAHEGNAILYEPERSGHQAQGTCGCLAPCSSELVVKLRVLKMSQIEGQRLFENHHVDALSDLRTHQGLTLRQAALSRSDGGDEDALEHHEHHDER